MSLAERIPLALAVYKHVGARAATQTGSVDRDLNSRNSSERTGLNIAMPSARDIVEHYFEARYRGDASTARSYLADDLSFRGPAAILSNADQYLKATEHVVRAINGVAKRKIFVDGQDVCIFYDLLMDSPVGSIPIAEWYHLERGKISSIQTILDTAPFTSPAATGETAIDPVCGMTVVKQSAAATRQSAAETYYFCNPGCAEAFDDQPERYASGAA